MLFFLYSGSNLSCCERKAYRGYGATRGYGGDGANRGWRKQNPILKDCTNHIIKKSIAYRAKYRVTSKQISPLFVVPHPCNRGGDPVKSLRTKQLSGNLVTDGYDPTEAQSNAVAVEQKSDGSPHMRWKSFQDHFANNVQLDPDMAWKGEGIIATTASLAHSHLNCTNRNVICGKNGCECPEPSAQSSKSAVAEKNSAHAKTNRFWTTTATIQWPNCKLTIQNGRSHATLASGGNSCRGRWIWKSQRQLCLSALH